jgi:hypothetical protein
LPAALNLHAYVDNDPTQLTDPLALFPVYLPRCAPRGGRKDATSWDGFLDLFRCSFNEPMAGLSFARQGSASEFESFFSAQKINIHDPRFLAWWELVGHRANAQAGTRRGLIGSRETQMQHAATS